MTRLLLVEDEQRLANAIARGLSVEGYAVDVAFNGVDGQWLADENLYDVIVLDLMLPGRDGLTICTGLRDRGDSTPILVLTARDRPRDIASTLDAGADDYLVKPFALVVLLARLRALLRRGERRRLEPLAAGDLHLDLAARRCDRAGQPVELTTREFAVLAFLVRRAGDAVSKLEILENVWDFAFDGDPNIVEVYIRRLRRKIDEPFGRETIETVRGLGYRLRPEGG